MIFFCLFMIIVLNPFGPHFFKKAVRYDPCLSWKYFWPGTVKLLHL